MKRLGIGGVVVAAMMALVGCTEGAGTAAASSEIGSESSPITFQTRKDLPMCTDVMSDLYAYIEDEHVELGCVGGKWDSPIEPTH